MRNKPCVSILHTTNTQLFDNEGYFNHSTISIQLHQQASGMSELRREIQTCICSAADNQHTVLINHNDKNQHTHMCKHTYWGIPLLQE